MTKSLPSGEKTNATLQRKPDSAGDGISGGTSKPSSRESSFRFFASCSAYGTPGSVQPPQTPKCLQCRLLDLEEIDLEHQRRVGRDHAAGAAGAVTHRWRNREDSRAAYLHAGHAFIPARNHLARTEREIERLIAVFRTVELLPAFVGPARVVEPTSVMNADQISAAGLSALADLHVLLLQLGNSRIGYRFAFGKIRVNGRAFAAGDCNQQDEQEDSHGLNDTGKIEYDRRGG